MYSLQATWAFQISDVSILSQTLTRQKSYYEHCTNDVRSVTRKARTVTSMVRQVHVYQTRCELRTLCETVTNIVRMVPEAVEDTLNITQMLRRNLHQYFVRQRSLCKRFRQFIVLNESSLKTWLKLWRLDCLQRALRNSRWRKPEKKGLFTGNSKMLC